MPFGTPTRPGIKQIIAPGVANSSMRVIVLLYPLGIRIFTCHHLNMRSLHNSYEHLDAHLAAGSQFGILAKLEAGSMSRTETQTIHWSGCTLVWLHTAVEGMLRSIW